MNLLAGKCRLAATLGLLLIAGGCATHRIDWAARVGNYTFDQAVGELGPPDKQATLQDKSVVAEWLTRRGYVYRSPAYGYYGSYYPPVYPTYVDSYTPDSFLRLTFGPDGQLAAWKRLYR